MVTVEKVFYFIKKGGKEESFKLYCNFPAMVTY
jgi:hypothetical protein